MAFEVAEELIVMGGEVADGVVDFCGGVQDGLGVVGEAGEVAAVFLGEEGFDVFAFFGVVKLKGVVGAGGEKKFARVVEIEGCDGRFRFRELEELETGKSLKNKVGIELPLSVSRCQSPPKSSV